MKYLKSEENIAILIILSVFIGYSIINSFFNREPNLKYKWRQVSGPVQANIIRPNDSTTEIEGLSSRGEYQFELKVTDPGGLSGYDTVKVTYLPPNKDTLQGERKLEFRVLKINPIRDNNLAISISANRESRAFIYAYDTTGRRVLYYEVDLMGGENKFKYRIDTYEPGGYTLKVVCEGETITRKFVKI